MPNDLLSTDPIVAQNFYLEIDGENIVLSGVSGLDLEFQVVGDPAGTARTARPR